MKLYPALVLLTILALSVLPANGQEPSLASEGMTVIGHHEGNIQAVFVQDNYAYLGKMTRLTVLNTSAVPLSTVGQAELPALAQAIYVSGNYAYVAVGREGLRVINVRDPINPAEASSYTELAYTIDIYVSAGIAYVANWNRLSILNVSDPSAPTPLADYKSDWMIVGSVWVSANIAYLAVEDYEGYPSEDGWTRGWLWVVDVSEPSKPATLKSYYKVSKNKISDIYVSGHTAYIALSDIGAGTRGLSIIDVSNPANPVEVGLYETPGGAEAIHVSGDLAYIAAGSAGLRVLDVSDPAHPIEVGFYDTPGDAQDVFISKGLIYVADGEGGLFILRHTSYQVYIPFISR